MKASKCYYAQYKNIIVHGNKAYQFLEQRPIQAVAMATMTLFWPKTMVK